MQQGQDFDARPVAPRPITQELARYCVQSDFRALPGKVQSEAARAFLNWMGCALGGCTDEAVTIADNADAANGGHSQAHVIGRKRRATVASAAFLNCLSSTVNSFDDTHLETVTHPTGPVAAALLAFAETHLVSGAEFVNALALGIEVQCRLSNVLLRPPASANLGLFITGITGPVGAAAAVARLMRLDEGRTRAAMGLAAAQSAGIRGTHGGMAAFSVPANAARNGVHAAIWARAGMTCPGNVLEGSKGLVEVFGKGGNLDFAVEGLGEHFELLANSYKPYPAGIVAQPVIDACLEVAAQMPEGTLPVAVRMKVHPLALELTGRRNPQTPVEAQISLFHWAAAALVDRKAGLTQLRLECLNNPSVVALRNLVEAVADPSLRRDEAHIEVRCPAGSVWRAHIAHARGSVHRPMTDEELQAKFDAQADTVLAPSERKQLAHRCWHIADLSDVGAAFAEILAG